MMVKKGDEKTEDKICERIVPGTYFSHNGVCEINND
jgi:hypothetical protein